MAKAGTGKGNAFTARRPAAGHVVPSAGDRAQAQGGGGGLRSLETRRRQERKKEEALRSLVGRCHRGHRFGGVSKRKEMTDGILRARRGLEPLADKCNQSTCERCRRGAGAQAFLCQAGRAKFNTKVEAAVYAKCVPAMKKYAADE